MYTQYKNTEAKLLKSREIMKSKIPDIKKSLEVVESLKVRQGSEIQTHYLLTDNIWAQAKINANGKVALWLGANVMVEFTYDEAYELLSKNKQNAETNMKATEEDIEFIKDQITTTEVNIARLHNENVKQKQAAKTN